MTAPPPCRRCGGCCQAHVGLLARPADLERWRRAGRYDILAAVRQVDAGTSPGSELGDGAYAAPCPFLVARGAQLACAIYAARPYVCRHFRPGSARCAGVATLRLD